MPRPMIDGVPKSASESTKHRMAAALTAGISSGRVTRRKRCHGVQPRLCAASSSERLTFFSALAVIR